MIFQDELSVWCEMGVGRQTALAKQLGCSRQYINNITCDSVPIAQDQEERLRRAMNRVEIRESKLLRCAKNNVLKCAKMVNNSDKFVSEWAKKSLMKWSVIYSDLLV